MVTLGDSYTAGEGTDVPQRDSWPAQLSEALRRGEVRLWVSNLARRSFSSEQVIDDQLYQAKAYEPDLVTLQVGVNDIVYHDTASYRENIATILDELLTYLPSARIFVVTTPDHTLTDWGDYYGSGEVGSAAVAELNETLAEVASARGIEVIDISLVNNLVTTDPSLVIKADPPVPLPTAKQYAGWVEIIGPRIYRALATIEP